MNLRSRVSTVSDVPQIRTLTFVVDACKMLEQARKVSPIFQCMLRFSAALSPSFQVCFFLFYTFYSPTKDVESVTEEVHIMCIERYWMVSM